MSPVSPFPKVYHFTWLQFDSKELLLVFPAVPTKLQFKSFTQFSLYNSSNSFDLITKEHKNCNCWQFLLLPQLPFPPPALRSFVAATFSGCLPFKWRSEEKLFICLAIDFVAIGVSGDALLNVPPPFHSFFLYLVLCHVMWQLWNRKQAVGVSGHRKIEASNEVNVRFVACLAVIAFRGATL